MPIKQDQSDLPRSGGANAPLPSDQTIIAKPLLDIWWKQYQESPEFTRDKAIPELPLRASMMGSRCDRQLWYEILEYSETNPADIVGSYRMRAGQLIGNEVAKDFAPNTVDEGDLKHGWWSEDETDLRNIGYPGSAHGDLVYYDHGTAMMIAENKTVGGFPFKIAATAFKGQAEGAKWAHIMQAALVAISRDIPMIIIFYLSMEPIGRDIAERNGLDEYEMVTAEWHFQTEDFRRDVTREIARQNRILRMATPNDDGLVWRPERVFDSPEVPSGAMAENPAKGTWIVLSPSDGSVIRAGTKWFCSYCRHRDRCIADGPEMVQIPITGKPLSTPLADVQPVRLFDGPYDDEPTQETR